jgi:hypothetical protein
MCGAQGGICRVNNFFFSPVACFPLQSQSLIRPPCTYLLLKQSWGFKRSNYAVIQHYIHVTTFRDRGRLNPCIMTLSLGTGAGWLINTVKWRLHLASIHTAESISHCTGAKRDNARVFSCSWLQRRVPTIPEFRITGIMEQMQSRHHQRVTAVYFQHFQWIIHDTGLAVR